MDLINLTFPPAFILFFGALLLPFLPSLPRKVLIILLPVLALLEVWSLSPDSEFLIPFAGFDLNFLQLHEFSFIFANAFCLATLAGGIYALKHHNKIEITAAYILAACALAVCYVGDLLGLFIIWEIMALTSIIVISHGGSDKSRKAAFRFAMLHFFGGAFLIAAITANYHATGSLDIALFAANWSEWMLEGEFDLEKLSAWCIFIAILINFAAPPFSSWLPDSYPESSPWGGVFLSAFLTNNPVFVVLTIFSGKDNLVQIGIFMIFYGIIYGLLENNFRRILSYAIINQLGFMAVAIGVGTQGAQIATALLAFANIIFMPLLFASAGSVITMTGNHKCSDVGGIFHSMRFTAFAGLIGALSIAAFPLTSGFLGNSLILSSLSGEHNFYVWLALLAASACVFLHAGGKFPYFVFFHKDSGLRPDEAPINMRVAMGFLIILCLLPSLRPDYLYNMIPNTPQYQLMTAENVVSRLQLLFFAALAFFAFIPVLRKVRGISLDFDWFTRKFLLGFLHNIERIIVVVWTAILNFLKEILSDIEAKLRTNFKPDGPISRTWKISDTVIYTTVLLGLFMIVYYYL